jgi:hypothetical protein
VEERKRERKPILNRLDIRSRKDREIIDRNGDTKKLGKFR